MADKDSTKKIRSHLMPVRHMQHDFFIADTFDCTPKDDTASMEHPVFALKTGDTAARLYSHNGISIAIKPNIDGLPTIFDKDIWIYCISKLVEAINNNEPISRTIRFTAYDYLVNTNRDTSGRAYERLRDSLERLKGTSITTDIATAGKREAAGFGLIDDWRIVEKDNKTERMIALEVTLPRWLYNSVSALEVLTISPEYFRIRKPLDRRIYELCRKHCGHQPYWIVSIDLLHKKSGSSASIREFRRSIKCLAESNELPDYRIDYEEDGVLIVFPKTPKGAMAKIKKLYGKK